MTCTFSHPKALEELGAIESNKPNERTDSECACPCVRLSAIFSQTFAQFARFVNMHQLAQQQVFLNR